MCDPFTGSMLLSGGLAAANAGFSLYGESQKARAAEQAGRKEAMHSVLAAHIADANARMAMIEASGRVAAVDRNVDAVIGHNVADTAARGLDPNQGSPLLEQAYVAAQGNIDKHLIGARASSEAASLHYGALGELMKGSDALMAAKYGAGTAWLAGLQPALTSLSGLEWGKFSKFSDGLARFSADPGSAFGL